MASPAAAPAPPPPAVDAAPEGVAPSEEASGTDAAADEGPPGVEGPPAAAAAAKSGALLSEEATNTPKPKCSASAATASEEAEEGVTTTGHVALAAAEPGTAQTLQGSTATTPDDDDNVEARPAKAVKLTSHEEEEQGQDPTKGLPPGWSAHVDPATGATYFWNAALSAASWDRPTRAAIEEAAAAEAAAGLDASGSAAAQNPSHAAFLARTALATDDNATKEGAATTEYSRVVLGAATTPEAASASASSPSTWVKHADPETGMPYFVNASTNETQWEVPPEGFIDATVFGPAATTRADAGAGAYEDYTASATFNARTGQFGSADGQTYWEAHGAPNDREGRMMSHFFDLSTLEQNRKEAEEKKKKLKKYDWRKYKEMKKKEKTKRRVQALLKD